jgi:pimeloyl-ACP methyl ester carboxylesterase
MMRRSFLRAVSAASLSLAWEASLEETAYGEDFLMPAPEGLGSDAQEFAANAAIVLAHGAWADGSCWDNVILPLQRRGLQVVCAPLPLTSLTNDTTALNWTLERTAGPVILVGHAYSGAVIAAVNHDRVKGLIFISALAPDEGETVTKVFYLNPNSPEAPKLVPDSHGLIWMPRDGFRRAVAHKASRDQTDIAGAVQRPIAVPCIQEPAPAPTWKSKPAWYLIAEEDRMINPQSQRFMAERMHATIHSHPVDHTAMYSQPGVVIDLILDAARHTLV